MRGFGEDGWASESQQSWKVFHKRKIVFIVDSAVYGLITWPTREKSGSSREARLPFQIKFGL